VSAPPENSGEDQTAASTPRRSRRWLWALASLGALLVLIVGIVLWVLNTEAGTRWAANRAVGFMGGKLELAQIQGALAGPLTVQGIRFNDPDAGADVRVARVQWHARWRRK